MGKRFFLCGVSQLPSVEMTRYPIQKYGSETRSFLTVRNLFWALFKHYFKQKLLQNRLHSSSSTTKILNITRFPRVLYWNIVVLLKESLGKQRQSILTSVSKPSLAEKKTHPAPHPRFCASLDPPHFQKLQHPTAGVFLFSPSPRSSWDLYIIRLWAVTQNGLGFQAAGMKQWVMCYY